MNDNATLEEVFKSRSFGQPIPETPPLPVLPEAAAASRFFFGRNRFIASGAVAAAALSVVAGLSIGAGPVGQSLLSAHSGTPAAPDFGTTPTTGVPGPSGGTPAGIDGAGTAGTGNQSTAASQVSGGSGPTAPAAAIVAGEPDTERGLHAGRHPDGGGDGFSASGRGSNGHIPHDDHDDDYDDDAHNTDEHDDHHDVDSGFVGHRWCRPGWRR